MESIIGARLSISVLQPVESWAGPGYEACAHAVPWHRLRSGYATELRPQLYSNKSGRKVTDVNLHF